jgi:hypothetical protein
MGDGHDVYYVVLHRKKGSDSRDAIGLSGGLHQAKLEKPKKQGVNINPSSSAKPISAFALLFKDVVAAIDVYRSLDETIALLRKDGSELNIRIHFDPVISKFAKKEHTDDERVIYSFDRTHTQEILSALAKTTRGMTGLRRLPRLLLIGLVSEYDVFLSELIRKVIVLRPQRLAGSDKVDASQVLEFSSKDDAREYLIEREVDSIMVQNHLDQLEELSKLSGATIDVKDEAVRKFLEICERRNLFAHTGGLVSGRYIRKCNSFNIQPEEWIKPGVEIHLDRKYFADAVATVEELCIKLCHFIWHKVAPQEHELADATIHEACLDLIRVGDTGIARRILRYVTNQTKISNEVMHLRFILLYATALKLCGDIELACQELDKNKKGWAITEARYRILVAAIKDNKEAVFRLIESVAKSGQVTLENFRTWPAFGTLRSDLAFQEHIRKAFGKELIVGSNLPAASTEPAQVGTS